MKEKETRNRVQTEKTKSVSQKDTRIAKMIRERLVITRSIVRCVRLQETNPKKTWRELSYNKKKELN